MHPTPRVSRWAGASRLVAAAVLAAALLASCAADATPTPSPVPSNAPATPGATANATGDAACDYLYEWVDRWRFPIQGDPHAAYTYVAARVTTEPIAYLITGPFPYASWTSWTVYDSKAVAYSLVSDHAITPDTGSTNPYVPGNLVLADRRDFSLLVLPEGVDTESIAPELAAIPASNVLATPTGDRFFILAYRVYQALPGYNTAGAGGPTTTPLPEVRAVNYETGETVDCATYSILRNGKPPTEMPAGGSESTGGAGALLDGFSFPFGDAVGSVGGSDTASAAPSQSDGALTQFAPTFDPDRIEFTRPPLLPGADVSEIPTPDSCAGYLGAAMDPTRIGLIRMPHVAEWFASDEVTPTTTYAIPEAAYVSFTQYGSGLGSYTSGEPGSGSLADEELLVDDTGGSTIVVWPRTLTQQEQEQVFAYARQQGWALMQGGEASSRTSANVLIRLKAAAATYTGGYEPTADVAGVPCYFDGKPSGAPWSEVTGDEYVASGANIGAGAPQGVNCTVDELVGGSCLEQLQGWISETGGSYTAP